jgi:hypothetical protein
VFWAVARADVAEIAETLIDRVRRDPRTVTQRMQRYRTWTQNSTLGDLLRKVHELASTQHLGFFEAACWYLTVLREKPIATTIGILKPAAEERAVMEAIVELFDRGRDIA